MDELIARVEAATGPDRELDLAIALAVGAVNQRTVSTKHGFGYSDGQWACSHVEQYTASLDAAMKLVPEGLGFDLQRYWLGSRKEPAWMCEIASGGIPSNPRQVFASEDAWSAALAVVAAALRARLRQGEGERG